MTAPERVADRLRGNPPPVFTTINTGGGSSAESWEVYKVVPGTIPEWLATFCYEVDAKIFQAMKTASYEKS